jgi:hypothetical protein
MSGSVMSGVAIKGGAMTYKGPVRLTDARGEPYTLAGVLEWVSDEGDWSGVLTGPLDWSALDGNPLTLELPFSRWWDVPFVSPVEIDLIVGESAGVHGRASYIGSGDPAPARVPAWTDRAS